MLTRKAASLTAALLLASLPSVARQDYDRSRGQDRNSAYQDHRDNRGYSNQQRRGSRNFYNGVRDGGRGGQYYEPNHAYDGYDARYTEQHRGGIGPGKGALIGGAGGAVLGAVLGGGLKGSLIGGAAGAGIGAIVGDAAQNHRRDSYDRH